MLDGLIDVCNVRPKLGERGTLVWDGSSKLIKHLRQHMKQSVRFEYDCSTVCDDFGTIAHAQGKENGAMVALVMKVTSLEEQQSSNEEPYLVVRGPDMDSNSAYSLRIWRYHQNDMRTDSVYIIRGLKVVPDMY